MDRSMGAAVMISRRSSGVQVPTSSVVARFIAMWHFLGPAAALCNLLLLVFIAFSFLVSTISLPSFDIFHWEKIKD